MVDDLVAAVDLGHLNAENVGKTFSKLKITPGSCPSRSKLKETAFWKDSHTFHKMYDILRGDVVSAPLPYCKKPPPMMLRSAPLSVSSPMKAR